MGLARTIAGLLGAVIALSAIIAANQGFAFGALQGPSLAMAGVTFWVATWWISEFIPIAATSLLPLVLLPFTEVLSSRVVATAYMDRFIVLMMAGFMAALAIERWGLHRRLALWVLLRVGSSPRRLVLGTLIASGFLSMWISNTATALIMLPIATALVARLDPDTQARGRGFAVALFLAVAYGSSIGGLATPLGSPPNLIYLGAVEASFGHAPSFLGWMMRVLPISLVLGAITYIYFVYRLKVPAMGRTARAAAHEALLEEYRGLGPMRPAERRVLSVFVVMILLWISRSIQLGSGEAWGWASLLGLADFVDDSTVAVFGALALFVIPAGSEKKERLLDWETAQKIPWEIVLLFGGGLAIAQGFGASGLSGLIAEGLSGLVSLPPILFTFVIALVVVFVTEVTSNTALATLMMPILAPVALSAGLPPEQVMLPAALAASCAFMLPVATPPNAVVYASNRVPIATMAGVGFWLNIIAVIVLTLALSI